MNTEYGTYTREMDDRWFGDPLTAERLAGITWGIEISRAAHLADEDPDVLIFQRTADGQVHRVDL